MKATDRDTLLKTLKVRFDQYMPRHQGVAWGDVAARLDGKSAALLALQRMEDTGGEPDVIAWDRKTGLVTFCDCSPESPTGRRSLCYDRPALDARKENKPQGSALGMAEEMGIDLLTVEQYQALQALGKFDAKTSSWVLTPAEVRQQGGALFGDRRYGRVFIYHNGVQSYYAARGFRGTLSV